MANQNNGLTVTLAGQTIPVRDLSIKITDTLGQGAGSGGEGTGRASTCEFETSLGPAASAVGAGTTVSSPTLVRMGETKIFDKNNNQVYGGYATKLSDQTVAKQNYTKVECADYWQFLDRIMTGADVYDGVSDLYILNDLAQKYAPWLDLSRLPTTPNYTFYNRKFQHTSLQKAFQKVADVTGFQIWIGWDKVVHYESPKQAQTAPFAVTDSGADFHSSFYGKVTDYEVDDNSAINRVTFFGGKHPSNDFTQDISTQANGNNTLFVLAYYPHKSSDGKYHLKVNGAEKVLGYALGSGDANTLKSKGGTADALLNADAQTITFDVAPAAGASVTFMYRYEMPLIVQVVDQAGYQYYGMYLDAVITDDTVFDQQTAVQRCKLLLLEQSKGLTTLKLSVWRPGLQAGQLMRVDHSVRGIHDTFIIQEVDTNPLGGGNFRYDVTLGAWNWNLVDVVKLIHAHTAPEDDTTNADATPISIESIYDSLNVVFSFSYSTATMANFFPKTTLDNDGTDAFPGFCSI